MTYQSNVPILMLDSNMSVATLTVSAATVVSVMIANAPLVTEIPSAKYRVLTPIPVEIEVDEYDDVIATFREAGISMSGGTQSEAITALAEQLAAVFTKYKKAAALGPWATKQLKALEKYIGERVKPA
jgi:hypothetical protein